MYILYLPIVLILQKSGTTNTSIPSSTGTSSNSTEASGPREIKKPFALTYELREKLGQGQYAIVHKGIRKSDGMIVGKYE